MQLDKITTVIRPRGSWEAVDLGFVMARTWWRPMVLSWVCLTLPLFVVLQLIFGENLWLTGLVIWWLKPLWERSQLYILSHALFGEVPSVHDTLKAMPKLAFKQLFASLLWRRFSLTRSMDLPVLQLEGLSGKVRSQRLSVLHRSSDSSAAWLTIVGVHIETFIQLSLVMLVFWFLPEDSNISFFELWQSPALWFQLLTSVSYYVALCVVAPFYVAAGFGLYINRRTHLEAWDVEVTFRRLLEKRMAANNTSTINVSSVHAVVGLLVVCLTLLLHIPDSLAQSKEDTTVNRNSEYIKLDQQSAGELVEETFEHADFNRKRVIKLPKFLLDWEFSKEPDEPSSNKFEELIAMLAELMRLLFWAAAIALLLYVVFKVSDWLQQYMSDLKPSGAETAPPEILFGLDVRESSLPDNITQVAQQLHQQGRTRDALALLYRAMLSMLLDHYKVPLRAGNTEYECVRLAQSHIPELLSQYFSDLSQAWINIAYGHRLPTQGVMESLCARWPEQEA